MYYAEASEKGGEFLWSVRLYVCLRAISSQLLGPSRLIFSGYVGLICGSALFRFELDMLRNKIFLLVGPFCVILKKLDFHPFFALVKFTSQKWLDWSQLNFWWWLGAWSGTFIPRTGPVSQGLAKKKAGNLNSSGFYCVKWPLLGCLLPPAS